MHSAAEQLFFKGNHHLAARELERAEACFRQAVTLCPVLAEAHANLGWLLESRHADEEADERYLTALALDQRSLQIHLNYGAFLSARKRFDEAEAVYRRAALWHPLSAPLWSNLAVLCAQMGRFDEAEAHCRTSLALDPQYARAHINLSYLCLREGRFDEGWTHYLFRSWQCQLADVLDCPRWEGQPLAGRSIIVGHEGGHGDMIQFARYAAVLKQRGASRVTLIVPRPLHGLFDSLDAVDELILSGTPLPRAGWDFWASLMSLPGHCGTRVENIPAALPYLRAEPARARRWNAGLPTDGLRIGLAWKGNPDFENDADRSLASLDLLNPLAEVPGARFISLQKGAGEDEAQRAAHGALQLLPLGGQLQDFADTAALVANLDLAVCVDTAVAHLAAALGTPCWVLLPHHMADWRWLTQRTDSPWYPGVMRLFRQSVSGDWSDVIQQVTAALTLFAQDPRAGKTTPAVRASA